MDSNIKTIAFNQDFTCLSVGTASDYRVYNCDPFGECFHKSDDGGASIVEMLFSTSLIAIVGLGDKPSTSTRRLKIINTKRKTVICELTFPTSVLAVKLNRKRLIVVLFDQIYIYEVSNMKLLHTIETVPNKLATVALSSDDNSILCFPSSRLSISANHDDSTDSAKSVPTGSLVVFDAAGISPLNVIPAHKMSLLLIALSKDGKLVATLSLKGTILRVFDTSSGKKLFEFRRGSYGTKIKSLNFNHNNTFLSCSSSTGTIHIFKLSEETQATLVSNELSESESSGSVEEDREERIIPQQVQEPNTEELNQILNVSKNRSQAGGRRSSSLSEYLWNKSSHITQNVKGQLNNYLPSKVQSILEPKRDFAYIKLPYYKPSLSLENSDLNVHDEASSSPPADINTIVGMNSDTNSVLCADNYGNFYVYQVPMDRGGECILVKQFSFKESG